MHVILIENKWEHGMGILCLVCMSVLTFIVGSFLYSERVHICLVFSKSWVSMWSSGAVLVFLFCAIYIFGTSFLINDRNHASTTTTTTKMNFILFYFICEMLFYKRVFYNPVIYLYFYIFQFYLFAFFKDVIFGRIYNIFLWIFEVYLHYHTILGLEKLYMQTHTCTNEAKDKTFTIFQLLKCRTLFKWELWEKWENSKVNIYIYIYIHMVHVKTVFLMCFCTCECVYMYIIYIIQKNCTIS